MKLIALKYGISLKQALNTMSVLGNLYQKTKLWNTFQRCEEEGVKTILQVTYHWPGEGVKKQFVTTEELIERVDWLAKNEFRVYSVEEIKIENFEVEMEGYNARRSEEFRKDWEEREELKKVLREKEKAAEIAKGERTKKTAETKKSKALALKALFEKEGIQLRTERTYWTHPRLEDYWDDEGLRQWRIVERRGITYCWGSRSLWTVREVCKNPMEGNETRYEAHITLEDAKEIIAWVKEQEEQKPKEEETSKEVEEVNTQEEEKKPEVVETSEEAEEPKEQEEQKPEEVETSKEEDDEDSGSGDSLLYARVGEAAAEYIGACYNPARNPGRYQAREIESWEWEILTLSTPGLCKVRKEFLECLRREFKTCEAAIRVYRCKDSEAFAKRLEKKTRVVGRREIHGNQSVDKAWKSAVAGFSLEKKEEWKEILAPYLGKGRGLYDEAKGKLGLRSLDKKEIEEGTWRESKCRARYRVLTLVLDGYEPLNWSHLGEKKETFGYEGFSDLLELIEIVGGSKEEQKPEEVETSKEVEEVSTQEEEQKPEEVETSKGVKKVKRYTKIAKTLNERAAWAYELLTKNAEALEGYYDAERFANLLTNQKILAMLAEGTYKVDSFPKMTEVWRFLKALRLWIEFMEANKAELFDIVNELAEKEKGAEELQNLREEAKNVMEAQLVRIMEARREINEKGEKFAKSLLPPRCKKSRRVSYKDYALRLLWIKQNSIECKLDEVETWSKEQAKEWLKGVRYGGPSGS